MTDRDITEYEEQEWPIEEGETQSEIEYEFLNGGSMKYLVQDPETETIMSFIAPQMGEEEKTQSERQFELNRDSIVAPELTMERWRDLRTADQIGLTNEVSEAIGLDRVLGNAVDSRDHLPDELLPE
ncbi:hypothetical protein PhiCh1p21 [Natrialba phage PhiCh1]|uniref:Virus protein phiCh1-VP20 n=2 Tax=root TaxID=1 RepID=D3T2G8_NATMM|nr:hypothetical protein [Natrialba magadii]NP_665938.1 hypothetical protein PhiCh1p21 [Natrialba phage PhiCh1]YP_010078050.1 uncharacterized protein KMC42_gp20 [Natrialba phage PhiCh1]AAM88694.1 unknown [Natrialba phage PhiCh1]ADD07777.1 virus protein phiCh1-VP20 [Natrialba magadii ATCC 43099]ELY23024.1 hypothetical protein C500_21210 [Natrialba magadii ATCC 43099]QBJ01201.1 uncharacterized protein PhiCh1_095 [Natrialba phage PhiCh1]